MIKKTITNVKKKLCRHKGYSTTMRANSLGKTVYSCKCNYCAKEWNL